MLFEGEFVNVQRLMKYRRRDLEYWSCIRRIDKDEYFILFSGGFKKRVLKS